MKSVTALYIWNKLPMCVSPFCRIHIWKRHIMKSSTIQQALRHPAMNVLKRPVTVKKQLGYESSEWHLEEAEHSHAAPAQRRQRHRKGYNTARHCSAKTGKGSSIKNCSKPLRMVREPVCSKQAQTIDQSCLHKLPRQPLNK